MELDEYFKKVDEGVSACIKEDISAQCYVEVQSVYCADVISEIINIRKDLLIQNDKDSLTGYLELGYFKDFELDERMALFAYIFDISRALYVKSLKTRLLPYKNEDVIFSKDNSLFELLRQKGNQSKDDELLDSSDLNCVFGSEIFERNGYYYKLDPDLRPVIFTSSKIAFPNAQIYIRLDPTQVYESEPAASLSESVLFPANPNWWKQLRIHHRSKEGASYNLDAPESPRDDIDRYWDFYVRGVRRLDVIAKRNPSGNLSMTIEELSCPRNEGVLLIGRCVHLDTDSEYGTDFTDAVLNHLDLAINVYEGDDVKTRFNINLATGEKPKKATFRSHLFRIEEIPLTCVLLYCLMFFQSRSLTGEWISNQFELDR